MGDRVPAAQAFTHWDGEDEVPANCATCHSGKAFVDFIGGDGSEAGKVDHPVAMGSVINCEACHNQAAAALDSVTFPSGVAKRVPDASARCMVCHQGRQSTPGVNRAIGSLDDDTVSSELGFLNVHYRAAAASLLGTEVKGAYEYDGKQYLGSFPHPEKADSCIECHDPHSLEVRVLSCGECHKDQPLKAIRTTLADLDGDGDTSEGVAGEIATMHAALLEAITGYGASVAAAPIFYDAHAYPYYFNDTNANGVGDAGEAIFPNRYQSWTPRLLRASYNYQFVAKDPGAYAHNPRYITQVLFDSLEDLSAKVSVDRSRMVRP